MIGHLRFAAVLLAFVAAPAFARNDCDSPAANDQSVGTYSQLLDGQPGSPNQPGLTVTGGTGSGADQLGATLSVTPGSKPFWCDMNLTLGLPGVTLVGDRAQVDNSYDIAWEQRWRADDAHGPTFSTFVGIEIPVDSPGENVQFTFEAVLARTVAKGETLYLDAIVQDDDEVRVRDWDAGFIGGWRHDIGSKGVSLVIDGGRLPGDTWIGEAALQLPVSGRFSIGPGVSWSSYKGASDVTVGVSLSRAFGPRGN